MPKKIDDKFICPRCGKKTIEEVERLADGEFFAIHSRDYGLLEGRTVPCEIITRSCNRGSTVILQKFTPCERLLCDMPKSHFPKKD